MWRQRLTKERWGGNRPVAPGHHDADPRLDEGHREVYDLWPFLVDSERPHCHVSVLQHHLEEEDSSAHRDLSRYLNCYFGMEQEGNWRNAFALDPPTSNFASERT